MAFALPDDDSQFTSGPSIGVIHRWETNSLTSSTLDFLIALYHMAPRSNWCLVLLTYLLFR